MKVRGIEFGDVWVASGMQGFFGEGYWFHHLWKPFGFDLSSVTFVAKTTTLTSRSGNMSLASSYQPQQLCPKCIIVKWREGVALNAVGLSGPGALQLFNKCLWQKRRDPFWLSFMSVAETADARLKELTQFVRICKVFLPYFHTPVGLQINYSCPNVGIHADDLVQEVEKGLDIASKLNIPLAPKFNVLLPIDSAVRIAAHPACDALCLTNTLPWGAFPDRIDWEGIFGQKDSPLAEFGGGGLSGWPLLPFLIEWVGRARKTGIKKPMNLGGGILSVEDARSVMNTGGNGITSVALGCIAILRPWRVRGVVRYINERQHTEHTKER